MKLARGAFYYYLEPDPWSALVEYEEAMAAFKQTEDSRGRLYAETGAHCATMDLGEVVQGLKRFRESLALAHERKEAAVVINLKVYLALALMAQNPCSLEQIAETYRLTSEVHQFKELGPLDRHHVECALAQAQICEGKWQEAEETARKAYEGLQWLPPFQYEAAGLLVRTLLHNGRLVEAQAVAVRALGHLKELGGLGYSDVGFRLAAAEARHAAGDQAGAHLLLRETIDQIRIRADKIPEAKRRECYLNNSPGNVRTAQLAFTWLGERDVFSRQRST